MWHPNGHVFTLACSRRQWLLRTLPAVLSFALLVLGAVLLSLEVWLSRTWAELSTDEIVFHLRASLSGTDTTVVWDYLLRYLPVALVPCLLVELLLHRARCQGKGLARPVACVALAGVVASAGALWGFSKTVGFTAFLTTGEDFVGEHYVDPDKAKITFPEHKRNLIYIFLESMELTFADKAEGGAWDENIIPELTELASEGETFSGTPDTLNGGIALPGCTWTMGAMFCQSSGTPLKLPVEGNKSGVILDDFFPGLVCLGDILRDQGYGQYLLLGSDASFGNRREYYTEHGNFEMLDYLWAADEGLIPQGYKVWWGLEDERLLSYAKDVLSNISGMDEPFNLTLLTVDTHFEDGYVCRLCGKEHGSDRYANVMSCSSRQIVEFVRWIQEQDFYKDTTIVISGDHPTMDKNFCDDVPDDYQRKTFTTILNAPTEPVVSDTRQFSTLDLFPTTLAALGCSIRGDRLGLGTNLYSKTPTLIEKEGLQTCIDGLTPQSGFLDSYSNAPTGEELVRKVLSSQRLKLAYTDNYEGESGFLLNCLSYFNDEVIESARLELTDVRTGTTQTYPMNERRSIYLFAPMSLSRSDLLHLRARSYVKVTGAQETLFATYEPPALTPAKQSPTHLSEM